MITLDIEHPFHALRVGERWRVDKDQIVFATVLLQPRHDIGLLQTLSIRQAIERQIAPRPIQIGF